MKTSLNQDWLFHYGDEPGADYMGWDDSAWERVTVPHDWAVRFPFDRRWASGTGYLPGGTAWYRKHFHIAAEDAKKHTRILFEGIYKHARIYVNSHLLGFHAYGYTSFSMDITPFIRAGENVISVRVEHEDVADSRWYTGSGITRPVWLIQESMESFLPDSIFIRTSELTAERALLQLSWETADAEGDVDISILGQSFHLPAAAGNLNVSVRMPECWSPDHPVLHRAEFRRTVGNLESAEQIVFGIRSVRFDPDRGLFLNGRHTIIKGVCLHHDAGCLGAAVPSQVWRKRLTTLKACGCNAVRTAHNPPDPALLDLCDELGFMVMDEAFDEWEGAKNKWWQGHNVYPPKHAGYAEDFAEWHERDLQSMIKRDRNHPSVILWSIGNEIDYPNDPYVTPLFKETFGNNDSGKPAAERIYDDRKPDASRLPTVARRLVSIVHALDDSRPVTSALSFPELSNQTGLAEELDLSGYNYRENFYESDHKLYPDRVILGSENSHDPACWFAVEDHPWIAGQFLWTGIDFLGECRGWPVRISQAGMLTLSGQEKPLYWQRKALWSREPFVRIACIENPDGKAGIRDAVFRWTGREKEPHRVLVITNQPEAELFLNGKSLGVQRLQREHAGCAAWDIPYCPGTLTARAGKAEDRLLTPGHPAVIDVSGMTGEDVVILTICLRDKNGVLCADTDRELKVQVTGNAELLGLENGAPDDLTPYSSTWRRTLNGILTAYVRRGSGPEPVRVFVFSAEGLSAECVL